MTVLVLAGATASGKTALAIELAQRFNAEIVGADSRQIYRGMPIGTAAPTADELAAVPHHLIGFLDPNERYSAARFAGAATAAILDIHARGKRAIVVGGTGFYIRSLTGDVALAPQFDEALRTRLAHEARIHPPEFLHEWLVLRDPARAVALEPRDTYRVMRALEVALSQEHVDDRSGALDTLVTAGLPFVKIFLDVPMDEVDRRISERTLAMLDAGLLDEAQRIGADAVAANAVGYPQALGFLAGWSTRNEMVATLARATRRYARRQRAWFRSEAETRWLGRDDVVDAARELPGWA